MLWARGGLTAWLALLLTGAGAVLTDNILLQLLAFLGVHLRESAPGLRGEIITLVLARPVPLVLLIIGIFYLWIYVRHAAEKHPGSEVLEQEPAASARRVAPAGSMRSAAIAGNSANNAAVG